MSLLAYYNINPIYRNNKMQPVEMDHVSDIRSHPNGLLLLNTGTLGLRYVTQLLTRSNTNIRGKGGITLPNEVWSMILKFTHEGIQDDFCLVKVDVVSSSPDTVVLRCFPHKFDEPFAGYLENRRDVLDVESYLTCAMQSTAETINTQLPELYQLSGTFIVVLDTTPTVHCLYIFLKIPDIIATIEGGDCRACNGERFSCPGCSNGPDFNIFMGCGSVRVACPLCMGMALSMVHIAFLECYGQDPFGDEAKEMLKTLEDRLNDLGYDDEIVPEGALNARE
ncbi:hypothetical protein F4781DRAFT_382170 [Annulohypoxylon bovei var. microspora]|nr:hypothetical protein F4781DRAFT_382170 [Annulohypoxylon bovei var. microspora]